LAKGRIADLSLVANANGFVLSITFFLGPSWVTPHNGISIGSAILQGSRTWLDQATSSVAIARILCTACTCDAA